MTDIEKKERKRLYDIEYRKKNREKLREYKKKWAEKNKEKVKMANAKYHKNKMINDNIYKLKHIISNIIRDSLKRKGYTKRHKSFDIIGCDIIEFKRHMESKFEPWMSWENYGNPEDGIFGVNKTWDIDHIIPLKNGITEEDIIKLNHYTNLQPLCSYYNRFIKKDKIEKN